MRFSRKHGSKDYFNFKRNVSKLVIASAGKGCLTSWRNLLLLVSRVCCPGTQDHCRKVPVDLWKENGRECTTGYQSSLVIYLLQRPLWKEKSHYEAHDNP